MDAMLTKDADVFLNDHETKSEYEMGGDKLGKKGRAKEKDQMGKKRQSNFKF